MAPLGETQSPFSCRECGDPLTYGRVLVISEHYRRLSSRATKSDLVCCDCKVDERTANNVGAFDAASEERA